MSQTRRNFLRQATALTVLSRTLGAASQMTQMKAAAAAPVKMLQSLQLPPFVDAMPLPERLHPPAAKRKGLPQTLRVAMREVHATVHRDLPAGRFWSYGDGMLAPAIEARTHEPLQIEWVNALPAKHFLPVDYTLHGCGRELPEVRTIVHVHGAKVPPKDDGYPTDWFVPGTSRTCLYPLEQDATALWYHDHAMGLNRLNIYAGLYGMFLIRDREEEALGLPSGKYEVPLMLCDRDFTADGQLFYPESGIEGHPWVPEFTADAVLVNGKIRPYFEVEPRMYRFRVVNVANSRFFALSLSERTPFQQIGSDQGLLSSPVTMTRLTMAPAERADLLIDFSKLAGKKLQLLHGPLGIVEFRVTGAAPRQTAVPAALRKVPRTPESDAVTTRTITLNEYKDRVGNSMVMLLNRKHWHEPTTETPKLDTTEIWEFVNLTEDVHPMHLHLVRFQVLDRRVFDVFNYRAGAPPNYIAPTETPAANEMGWKDTIQCPPGMVTRIIARFEGYAGKYLYHCHVLEHESNDMMRPFEVVA